MKAFVLTDGSRFVWSLEHWPQPEMHAQAECALLLIEYNARERLARPEAVLLGLTAIPDPLRRTIEHTPGLHWAGFK